ncbi:peptidase C14 caspase catalytic subunit p20 [Methylocella silvestris BL2]|uniref:Peptidase C14 caspase catalytic subunit p20 n=1 Tax=Methylocella silvestris (strain DSM 15510 / CIP 108128 / LMG 27833 / NCIMB 13906 / BL2) TaxID=395965 RepID=B8ERB3_METSB|nr:caspase family protein [Methylocella silvestris]ACK50297.1 peptidase C14 caspase catalytic subunit p20 [Methylocella silvestris BL2]
MLRSVLTGLLVAALTLCLGPARPARAQSGGARLALVIGNAQYAAPLATAANDAGLVAETLRGAGFDVTGAANLDQESLRRAFRDFLEKASQAGPNAIVFVYLAGRGLQYEGENYFVPIDAVISREGDAALQAVRVSDLTRGLASLPLRARIVVLDAARANSYAAGGHIAGGLALVDADPGALYAFNAAPGTIAPDEPGPYGAYAQALSELLRQGGAPIDVVFSQVRLRVNEVTKGAFAPWDAANISPPLILLEGAPNAPPVAENYAALQARPMRSFPTPGEAYAAALERDTIDGYQEFLSLYPKDPLARRVRALVAARREAITWRRAVSANSADAYWSYMQRYPKGPHYYDARRRLSIIAAPVEPPPAFDVYDFGGLPPPPPIEYEIIDGPVVIFDAGYPPPPPPPLYFLPPPPVEFISLPPPPPPQGFGFLPIPIPIPIPFGRYNGPAGRFDQPDFGHRQGGAGFGGAGGPGGGQAGGPGGQPGQPAQPAPGQPLPGRPLPAQPLPGQPAPGRPGQGGPPIHGLPGPGGPHQPPGPGAPVQSQPAPGQPISSQPIPGQSVPGQPGQGGPGKRGRHGQPGAAPGGPLAPTPPGSPGAAVSAPGGAATPPDHALPAGNNLPPLPAGGHKPRGPGGAVKPGAVGASPGAIGAEPNPVGAAPRGGGRPQRRPGQPPAVLQPAPSDAVPAAPRPGGAPRPGRPATEPGDRLAPPAQRPQAPPMERPPAARPQPAPQQMQQPRPQPQQMQQPRPQPQQMQQPRPQPQQMQQPRPQPQQMQQPRPQPQQMQQQPRPQPQQMQQPRPQPQQMQQQGKPAGKPPAKPGEENH